MNKKLNYWRVFLVFVYITIILLFINLILKEKDPIKDFKLENIKVEVLDNTSLSSHTNWKSGEGLMWIKIYNNSKLEVKLEPEVCEGEIMYEEDKLCQKFWHDLEPGEKIIVLVQDAPEEEKVLNKSIKSGNESGLGVEKW